MKLKVLVDNNTYIDNYYLGEPAVCYYINDNGKEILFDTGYSDIFINNAKKMNIALNNLSTIVISHGHNDHTGGLEYLFKNIRFNNIDLIAHSKAFDIKKDGNDIIGSPIEEEQLKSLCNLILTKEPFKISDNITFLGEIPKTNNFEHRKVIGTYQSQTDNVDDLVMDDSALVYKSEKGLFIITGCSHSGICNIIEYAKTVCNEDKVYGIIGGFHLFDASEQVFNTIEYFRKNNIVQLYPCHCVSFEAKAEMNKHIKVNEVGVGLELDL